LKVLVDTNVILDIALKREPFVKPAALLWRLAEQKEVTACLSNTSITDIFYIVGKHASKGQAREFIADILDIFTLVDIDQEAAKAQRKARHQTWMKGIQGITAKARGFLG